MKLAQGSVESEPQDTSFWSYQRGSTAVGQISHTSAGRLLQCSTVLEAQVDPDQAGSCSKSIQRAAELAIGMFSSSSLLAAFWPKGLGLFTMDLQHLLSLEVITPETLAWFGPLWEKELEDAAEIAECTNFQIDWDDAEHLAEERPLGELKAPMCTFETVEIADGPTPVPVEYSRSRSATAHGDSIWAASLAAALHLSKLLASRRMQDELHNTASPELLREVRIIELGAGIGIPSLFVARKLGDIIHAGQAGGCLDPQARSQPRRKQVYITDARSYHNLRQIFFSVLRHPHLPLLRVAPHNWGEVDSSGEMQFLMQQCQGVAFDYVVAADCVYNPSFHQPLLDSICHVMAAQGLAILTFSLHPNTAEENVWAFFDRARLRGLKVEDPLHRAEDLEPVMQKLGLWQANMGKRYLVHVRELSWAPP